MYFFPVARSARLYVLRENFPALLFAPRKLDGWILTQAFSSFFKVREVVQLLEPRLFLIYSHPCPK